jgi:hypothetical protein
MLIGYGSISSFHSVRYDLFFNETTNSAYFVTFGGRKYTIKLNDSYITIIKQNKKIWITLTQQMPRFINSNTEFNENDITIRII